MTIERSDPVAIKQLADRIFSARYEALVFKTDRLFGYLFFFQWLLGILLAVFISPRTWDGGISRIHIHVYLAVFLGGTIAGLPIYLAFHRPGATINRMIIAAAQLFYSVLFIHLTGGRIESHFHIFGSLAFLAFYRDWRPILIGTGVIVIDHFVRGAFWPESVYGVLTSTPWRALEHGAWIMFEDITLWYSIKLAIEELRGVSESEAGLECALKEAKSANRAAENYRYALDSSAIVATTNARGEIIQVNDNFCLIAKYPRERLLGKTHKQINSDHHPESFFNHLWSTISSGKTWSGEIQNKAGDGALYWVDTVIVPILADDGISNNYMAIQKEVTARKRLEESIFDKQKRLEEAVVVAEKANQAKSLFVANISHELRTPMHGIMSFSNFGQQKIEGASKEQLKSYFEEISDSAARLMTLLNDLLDLSKLESGKVNYSMVEQNIVPVAKSVIDEMSAFAEERGLKIELAERSHEVISFVDEGKIAQVFRNLISNAIKFSTKGTVVRIGFALTGEKVQCHITNKGVGVPELEKESIFDKFIQSSKTKTGSGGTGLGLAISREIIEHHAGKIWVESTLDDETKFIFELPAIERTKATKSA